MIHSSANPYARNHKALTRLPMVISCLLIVCVLVSAGCSSSSEDDGVTAKPTVTEAVPTSEPTQTVVPSPEITTPTDEPVTMPVLTRVVVEPSSIELEVGATQEFIATAMDADGNVLSEASIKWEVAGGLGTIDATGMLTAATKAGLFDEGVTAVVTLGDESAQGSASVTVNPGGPVEVRIYDIEVPASETQQLEFVALDEYGNEVSGLEAAWTLTTENAGTLTESGKLSAGEVARVFGNGADVEVIAGETQLTASGTVTVVAGPLDQIVIAPKPAEIGIGMTQQFVAVGADEYGNRIADLEYEWSVENGGGVIDETGLFTAGDELGTYKDTVKVTARQGDTMVSDESTATIEPDRIAFVSMRLDDQYDVYVMNADGSDVKRITSTEALEMAVGWSPDGRRLAYDSWTYDGGVMVMNDDGSWGLQIMQNAGADATYANASWSPSGTQFVVVEYSNLSEDYGDWKTDLYIVDVDGGGLTQLSDTPDDTEWAPAWSPDGRRIAYDYTPKGSQGDIYTMNADGSEPGRLTTHTANDTAPDWSPDGTQIAFMSDRTGFDNIYVMDTKGLGTQRLTDSTKGHDSVPGWSVDGSSIFFVSDRDASAEEGEDIYVIGAHGGSVRRVTDDDASILSISVAPRKRGVIVSQESVVLPNKSELARSLSPQQVIAEARGAIVKVETDRGSGSGFIIDESGLIITNNHVVVDAEEITVYLDDGTSYEATLRKREMVSDIAILKIEAESLPSVRLGDVGTLDLGERVVVLGYPLDSQTVSITSGLVSSVDYDDGRGITWVKTDAAVNPGNSGGPLMNLQGEVVGIVSLKYVGVAVEGVGYALSANTVNQYLPALLSEE